MKKPIDLYDELIAEVGESNDVDPTRPFIVWKNYKLTGKWYDTHARNLTVVEIIAINENDTNAKEMIKKQLLKDFFITQVNVYGVTGFFNYLIGI